MTTPGSAPAFHKQAQAIWGSYLGKPRDVVRQTLVHRQLSRHLPQEGRPLSVLDIGIGQGDQAIALARQGHQVTGLDASDSMLAMLENRLSEQHPEIQRRLRIVQGLGEQAAQHFEEASFDAVLCHGVLTYASEPLQMLQAIRRVVRPDGMVSLLTIGKETAQKQAADAQVLAGNYGAALESLHNENGTAIVNRSGVQGQAFGRQALLHLLENADLAEGAWYGVRTMTDHLPEQMSDIELDQAIQLDEYAGAHDPWRSYAPFMHTIAHPAFDDC